MNSIRLATIVGTRPELIRLSRIISKLDTFFDHKLIHTGQNYDYELNQIFFKDLGIRQPDFFLNAAGRSSAESIGNIIIQTDKIFAEISFDAMLVLGDTNSCLSVIAAKRRKIPIFHIEAGNRCFDYRVPEEINRRIVDHTSDINLTYSSIAREYLLAEGFPAERIIKVGSPMKEIISHNIQKINSSNILNELKLKKHSYYLISCHREENIDNEDRFREFMNMLDKLATVYKKPIIFSTHPRTRKKLETKTIILNPLIKVVKPLGYFDYMKLQIESKVVLSDSGTITEESSILNFPALNIRVAHERPEGMEEGAVMMVGCNPKRVIKAIEILEKQARNDSRTIDLVKDYDVNNVSEKVIRIIHSYTDYVDRFVWKKYL